MKFPIPLLLSLFFPCLQAQDAITTKITPSTGGPITLNTEGQSPAKSSETSSTGPWGTIDYYKVQLFCPPDYLNNFEIPSAQTEWIFPSMSEEEFVTNATNAGLPQSEV